MQFINAFNIYDLIFIIIILISAIIGLLRGGVVEIFNLSTWLLAFFINRAFGNKITMHLPKMLNNIIFNTLLHNIISYFIVLILIAIIGTILKKLIHRMVDKIGLNGVDHAFGMVFGMVRGVIISSILIMLINVLAIDSNKIWQQSKIYVYIKPIVSSLSIAMLNITHKSMILP